MRALLTALVALVLFASPVLASSSAAPSPAIPFTNSQANQPVLAPQTTGAAQEALAPAAVAEPVGEAPHAQKKAGLPQFDPTSYPKQIFWLFVTFAVMFAAFSRVILPKMAAALEHRATHVHTLVSQAQDMREEAERLKMEYETAIDKARADAKAMILSLQETHRKESEAGEAAFAEKTRIAMEQMESRIAQQRTVILSELAGLAGDLAVQIAQKTAFVSLDPATATKMAEQSIDTGKQIQRAA